MEPVNTMEPTKLTTKAEPAPPRDCDETRYPPPDGPRAPNSATFERPSTWSTRPHAPQARSLRATRLEPPDARARGRSGPAPGARTARLGRALQGGARYGDALLDASEDAWNEYLGYVAEEYPTFYVGDEGRIAKIHLSRDGYRIYEAMGRSNMLDLCIEHVREFLKEVPSEEADQIRLLLTRIERARQVRRSDDRPPGTSPLD